MVKRANELCPSNDLTDHEKEVRGIEERLKAEASAFQKRECIYRELDERFFSTSKEDILHILVDLRIKGVW
ncbi:hypothetical protein [Azospirillum argentinense]